MPASSSQPFQFLSFSADMQCNCLQHMLARHPVVWYMYSPMDTGQMGPYQVTLFNQISHCRSKAIGDSPWVLRYSRPNDIVGRL